MTIEVLGFLTGAVTAGVALLGVLRLERWRVIRAISGQRRIARPAGNALIWPSR